MRKLNDVPKERERVKGKGERRSERKEKEKREIATVVRKVPIDQYMGVHDDSTPYNYWTRNLLW